MFSYPKIQMDILVDMIQNEESNFLCKKCSFFYLNCNFCKAAHIFDKFDLLDFGSTMRDIFQRMFYLIKISEPRSLGNRILYLLSSLYKVLHMICICYLQRHLGKIYKYLLNCVPNS